MHGYTLPARNVTEFVKLVERPDSTTLESIDSVSSARRPLLAYGALVLDLLIAKGKPRAVVISAQGVREGLLHEQLPAVERDSDPLLRGAQDYNQLRSRDPRHGVDLIGWTAHLIDSAGVTQDRVSRRLQAAACLLSDIGWRAHPDYRGEQSLNVIAHAAFSGVDHPGRAFLALSVFHRYAGAKSDTMTASGLRRLLGPAELERTLLLAGIFRVAYLLSAGMAGILPRIPLACEGGRLVLRLPEDLRPLYSDRVAGRLKQLAKLLGREVEVR
jgi:exopolyphosphatase/guanosine-5'-triphosphate,3'-diphosphate pyrophosphatase